MRIVRALSLQLQVFAWATVLVGCELNIRSGAESNKEGPTATLTSPNSGALISASNASSFSFSGTCSESGATIQISINSGVIQENTTCSAGSWSRNIDLSPLPDGAINVSLTVVGSSQTASLGSVLSVTKDVVAPALASASVTNSSPTNSTSYGLSYGTITGSYSSYCVLENSTTLGSCSWTAGTLPTSFSVSSTENAKVLSIWVRDAAGNVSTRVDSNSVTLDTTAPSLASATVTNSDPTNSTSYSLTYGSITGAYSHYCILENTATVGSCSWTAGTLPASFTVSSTENAKVLSVWIRDTAGNVSTRADSNSVTLDTTAPILASVTVSNSSPTNNTSYSLSYGSITGSYSHYCQLENNTSVAGCVWQSGTLPSSYTVNGTQGARTISTWIRDTAGNVSTRVDSNAVTLDTVAPVLASASVSNSSPTNSTTYNLSYGSVTGTYADYCILENSTTVGSCSWTAGTLPASFTVGTTENAKVLSVWLRDSAGNVSTRVDSNSVTYLAPISMTWSLVNGANSINLTATPNHNLTVYYAVHNSNPGALTPAAIKALSGSCSGACVSAGSFAAVTTGSTQSISGLANKVLYFVSAVAEDAVGLDSTTKTYSGVLPRRNSLQVYTSALTSEQGAGQTVRYYIYVPTAYYNNPATNYPVIMYIHGFGDQSNNAANPESDFTLMDQTVISGKIAMGDNFNAIVVQPQCNEALWNCQNYQSTTMSTPYLAEVIDHVNANYRTNPKKFSATGMSFGASGALHLAYDYPAKVSAVVSIAGGLFTTGSRPAGSGNLCPRFATEPVAVWAFNNTSDSLYNATGVTTGATGPIGTYPGTFISTINTNCSGHPDARFTEFTDNTTFPANRNTHHISEFVVNGPYFDYFDACGSSGGTWLWKYWTGSACANDTVPPSNKVPLHPLVSTHLQTASTALTGSSGTFTSIFDWMTHFSKP